MSDREVYLEFVQGIVTRLSGQSFQLKGWSITLVSAILALAGTTQKKELSLIALLPAVVFWCLDTYYTALERRFRHLFEDAFGDTSGAIDLTFAHSTKMDHAPMAEALFSFSVAAFYFPIVVSVFLAYFLI